MLPLVPIFPVYNFFRQNIWHSIFDQFYFHHIFGDEMSVIRQDRQQTKALVVQQKYFGDQLNGYEREELQIFGCTAGKSTNICSSADQAAIVIEGAAVTSKPTEVYGKLRAVSLRRKSYQCIQINGSVSDCPTSKGF